MSEELEKLIDERQAARFMGLTPSALRKWRQKRTGLPFVRISARCVKYRVVDLEAFIRERRVIPIGPQAGEMGVSGDTGCHIDDSHVENSR